LNCQIDQTCLSCTIVYDQQNTCGSRDGGEITGQMNCNPSQNSRLCVPACTNNAGCVNTQGSNCMMTGLCISCRSNADCQTGNQWNGDGGEITGQTLCVVSTGICTAACNGNYGSGTSSACTATAANCHISGICANCVNDADCAAQDGPPGTINRNVVCDLTTRICIDPFSCGTVAATSADNAGCQARYPGQGKQNCNRDGNCLTCSTNALCYQNDGGRIPSQPRCDGPTGTCVSCQSNTDCPAVAANCHFDGLCYDCRKPGQDCPTLDGPPGTQVRNMNCDSVTGICVDFCTMDAHCSDDSCYPRCQVERGCCVECTQNAHCPVAQWRGTERATRTVCDGDAGWICRSPVTVVVNDTIVCYTDDDCTNSADGGACSATENMCVECLFDTHCTDPNMPACATGEQTCVECVIDAHCASGLYCGSDNACHSVAREDYYSYASSVTVGFFSLLPLLFLH